MTTRAPSLRDAGALGSPPLPDRESRHNSDHDGDVIAGIVNALLIEAMVAFFVLAMFTINVSAILKVFGV